MHSTLWNYSVGRAICGIIENQIRLAGCIFKRARNLPLVPWNWYDFTMCVYENSCLSPSFYISLIIFVVNLF